MRTIALAAASWFASPAPAPIELPLDEVEIVERAPMVSTSAPSMRAARSYLDDKEVIPGERQVGGGVLSHQRRDLFVRWAILDRGDASAPTSPLPLLRGGYDQSELTLGASYRFGPNLAKLR